MTPETIHSMLSTANGANHVGEYPTGKYCPMSNHVGLVHATEDLRLILQLQHRVKDLENAGVLANKSNTALKTQINDLLELIYNSAEGEICMGYKIDVESLAQAAHAITGINASQLRRRELNDAS